MNALNRNNAVTLSLDAEEANNNDNDEAVSMTLDLDAPVDIHARMPLSYVENIELHRELMRFNRPRPSRINKQKVSSSVRK
jgi:hypothetical protein